MQSLSCGPLPLHWLPPSAAITDDELRQTLAPAEWELSAAWPSAARRAEYRRSRWLIRKLTNYGGALGKKASGAPIWPPGWRGSLTHKDGFIGLALIGAAEPLAIGIDAEDPALMRAGFQKKICLDTELRFVASLSQGDEALRLRLLTVVFSFKEALFKAVFPLGERLFYFHDAAVTQLDQSRGTIAAQLRLDASPETPSGTTISGYFRSVPGARDFILTSAILGLNSGA